jgi:hypothetical protein
VIGGERIAASAAVVIDMNYARTLAYACPSMTQPLPRRVAILIHAGDRRAPRVPYQIWGIADVWRSWGIDVVTVRGPAAGVDADVIVNHVDLTVIPDDYAEYIARFPASINGRCLDISKRRVSTNLVGPSDAWEGPVIVKTDRNFGGRPERRLAWGRVGLALHLDTWLPRGGWRFRSTLVPDRYPVFRSLADVPAGVWANPALVIERFLPERDGDLFVVRSLTLFGDRWVNRRRLSTSPIVKATGVVRAEEVEPHPEVFEVARKLGLDRGKIDYVIQDGHAVVFDINRTNTMAAFSPARRLEICGRLAEGLFCYWPPTGGGRPTPA